MISFIAPLTIAAALAAACDSSKPTPATPGATATPAAATAPPATPTAPAVLTGMPAIDATVAAVTAADAAALRRLLRYTPTACVTAPQGLGAPPACRPGEAAGTIVDVFPVAQCEGAYVRPEDLQLDIPAGARLYGVYRVTQPFWPAGTYAAIFERREAAAGATAWELVLDDRGIVGVHLGCAMTPPQLAQLQHLTAAIATPPRSSVPVP
ncbi:MAG TPA: hypothetical protein VET66_09600 [Steroidobacteraceae bacterium]|nr:hypothetical protein [Steroidobacteraceae bacterium]